MSKLNKEELMNKVYIGNVIDVLDELIHDHFQDVGVMILLMSSIKK